jgi:Flp pilus assembly protein TadB
MDASKDGRLILRRYGEKIARYLLLALLSLILLVPSYATARSTPLSRAAEKNAKRQQKAMKKQMKAQRKAIKKGQKSAKKAFKNYQKHNPTGF